MDELDKDFLGRAWKAASDRDRRFGSPNYLRATELGNVFESIHYYPYGRYRMESESFWPRLRKVIDEKYWAVVEEPQIRLDFLLGSATLALLYAALAGFVGPWLWYAPRVWLVLAGLGLLSARICYRMAVGVAYDLGDTIRSCYDLFRLDLLEAFGLPQPSTFAQEREKWAALSRLVLYDERVDLCLAQPPKPS